jgi:antitoxin component of MazEF toxin-antitoxin module
VRSGTGTAAASGSQGSSPVSSVSSLAFEGSPRRLLYPASPAITLPESLARTVDSNRSVTVTFTVLADGSVPSALVRFTPQAALSPEIRDFLTKEFSRWRFEKSAQDGQARFLYSIRMQ